MKGDREMSETLSDKIEDFLNDKRPEKDEREQEKLRAAFVRDYSVSKIPKLKVDEYVIGKGEETFCYRLEFGSQGLGQIRGANSSRYGIWFGTHGKDKKTKYRVSNKFSQRNGDKVATFAYVKQKILELLEAGKKNDGKAIVSSPISPLMKYKLLYLYYPEKYLCTYSKDYLTYFAKQLGIPCAAKDTEFDLQEKLLEWKAQNGALRRVSNFMFNSFLYHAFGSMVSPKEESKIEREEDEKLHNEMGEDDEPAGLSGAYGTAPKPKGEPVFRSGHPVYPRDPKVSHNALKIAKYQCELGSGHRTFLKMNGKPYMESHHLIPMSAAVEFENSLDVEQNIVCLCSTCHNEIHYGKERDALIGRLFRKRCEMLEKMGIEIELEELVKFY